MNARDFGMTDDPAAAAEEDVRPHRGLSPLERCRKLLDLISFMNDIRRSLDPARRERQERIQDELDDPGRWWERVPSR
ncbi:MAG: hypothetical protein AAB578_04165 [Elusimicrobiota bacterium]